MKLVCPKCKRNLNPKGIEDHHASATVQCFCGQLLELRPRKLVRWAWPVVRIRTAKERK